MKEFFKGNALIIEDSKVNQMVLKSQLTRMGLSVEITKNGEDGLQLFAKNYSFDFIFMDLQMPIMGGVECTENIREENSEIPIVAVTANVTPLDRKNCKDCWNNDFIPKLLEREKLLIELEKWLSNK